jgi:hypothetical protein
MASRLAIIRNFERQLDRMGYKEDVDIKDGAIILSVYIKNGKITQIAREREFVVEAENKVSQ